MVGMSYRDPTTKELIKIPTGCAGGGSPVGTVVPYVGSTAPVGWVIADGRAHNSPALQSLLGSANTPDLRGKFILAASPTHAAKTSGGEEAHTLTIEEMPRHNHPIGFMISPDGAGLIGNIGQEASGTTAQTIYNVPYEGPTITSLRPLTIMYSGDQQPHNNMPPYYALMYIIKAWAESAIGGITLPDADARYVKKSGDTMTDRLSIHAIANGDLLAVQNDAYNVGDVVYGLRKSSDGKAAGAVVRTLPSYDYAPMYVGTPTEGQHAATKAYVDNTHGGTGVEFRYGSPTSPALANSIWVFQVPDAPAGKQLRAFIMSMDGATTYSQGSTVGGMEIGSQTGGNIVFRTANGAPVPDGWTVKIHYIAVFS